MVPKFYHGLKPKKSFQLFCLFALLFTVFSLSLAQDKLYLDANQPIAVRVANLLSEMTLAEKVGQMTQIDVARLMGTAEWDRGPLNEDWLKRIFGDYQVGSILSGGGAAPVPNTPEDWANMTNQLQKAALDYSRLKIPMLYGIDAVHGHNNVAGATIYPHNLGLAASWNTDLVETIGARVAQDLKALGTPWTFAPVADLGRDPRWGRFYESFGEDPLLAAELTAASVRGFQDKGDVAATLKHFVGYGQALNGFDRNPAFIDMRSLRSLQLPSFAAGINAGAFSMMVNSGSVNGIPAHSSSYLLQDLARNELGFEGVLISDWEDIAKLVSVHKVAKDFKDAVALSINAGIDMYMVPHDAAGFSSTLIKLVEEGIVAEARIDEAVSHILALKFKLGLFENPFVDASLANSLVIETERSLAKQAALESLTLLENKNLLPFDDEIKSLLILGPSSNSLANQMGGWTIGWQGISSDSDLPPGLSIIDALEQTAPEGKTILYTSRYKEASFVTEKAQEVDAIVVVLGEGPYAEGAGDSSSLNLPSEQLELLETLIATQKPLVAVIMAGRPLILPEEVLQDLDALIMAYLPGSEGGTALSDVLFGRYSPSGKLPFSWPKNTGQLPLNYDVLAGSSYDPLYPFGYGLSYSNFAYSNHEVKLNGMHIDIQLDVQNKAELAASEVVQVYLTYPVTGLMTPGKKLIGFSKVRLEPDETKTVTISIPVNAFKLIPGDITGMAEAELMPGNYSFNFAGSTKTLTLP